MDNPLTSLDHSCFSYNIHHADRFENVGLSNDDDDGRFRMDCDPQERPTKGGIAFKIVWALFVVIPIFFWWDEITEMAFRILH